MKKSISIKIILDRIMRHPLLQELTLETAVDYTVDFMRIVGVPEMFVNKVEEVEIENYRGLLPCDLYQIIQVRDTKSPKLAFRSSLDSFHLSEHKNSCINDRKDLTYKIQKDIIYTSLKEGTIEISYMAIEVDPDGYPTIPDNSSFLRALELYIKKQWFTILFDMGKIAPAVLQNTQQEYAWAVGDCQTEFNRMTLDDAESFFNMWSTMIAKPNEHVRGFKHTGRKEFIKLH